MREVTPLICCLIWIPIVIALAGQNSKIESVNQHSIDLNRQTYNRLQLERSQDRAIDNKLIQNLVTLEVMRATSNNPSIHPQQEITQ